MSLKEYTNKRSFTRTPEPSGGKRGSQKGKSPQKELRFVIQKHKASRLHYDFRLEVNGVLKSWAVPKGPSLNPADKRLAVMVEDHPFDYKDFEGIIPKGNYGAGSVIIWDEGTYEPVSPETKGKKDWNKILEDQLQAGSVKIHLHGTKVQGEYALVRMKGMTSQEWLLIKHKDGFAAETDILLMDKSVKSGKTLENLADPPFEKTAGTVAKKSSARKSKFPEPFSPMLATLTGEAFDDENWEFEVKWDGYRAMAFLDGKKTLLHSRNGHSFAERFPSIWELLDEWNQKKVLGQVILDGEIVALDDDGKPNFEKLQQGNEDHLIYYVFDILWHDGKDLKNITLTERKKQLASLLPENPTIRTGFSVTSRGQEFLDAVDALGFEGIIAKKADSVYIPGHRSSDWLKIKIRKRQEVIIAGYTKKEGSPKPFSALIMAVQDRGKLKFAGKVGTGFKDKQQRDILKKLEKLKRKTSPLEQAEISSSTAAKFGRGSAGEEIIWVSPTLVAEIYFTEITKSGSFRHPVFIAFRTDKDPKDVVHEYPQKQSSAFVETGKKRQTKTVDGHAVTLTNVDKVYWPEEGYTKGDMLEYYHQIAKYILPYLRNRPQSLNRFPEGIKGENFYQKDVTGKVPDWVEKYPYKAEGDRRKKHYMLCNNEAALLYMANLGSIEINPWSSTIQRPDHPDWCIIDLDPDKGNTFEQVIEVASSVHDFLEDVKIPSYCKTSGSSGLHIYIPLGAKYTYDQSQLFAKWIVSSVNEEFKFTSIERPTSKRKGKIYLDFLQNRPSATLAAPYSLRPKPGATVSMPLHWEEVKKGLQISDFTIENALDRLKSEGDLFKPVLGKGADLKKLLNQLE